MVEDKIVIPRSLEAISDWLVHECTRPPNTCLVGKGSIAAYGRVLEPFTSKYQLNVEHAHLKFDTLNFACPAALVFVEIWKLLKKTTVS